MAVRRTRSHSAPTVRALSAIASGRGFSLQMPSVIFQSRCSGRNLSLPFMIAPTGLNGIHWRQADIALASAAAKAGTGFALSTASTDSIEDVGAATSGTKWFQLYPWADRAFCARMLERAKAVGIQDAAGHRRFRDRGTPRARRAPSLLPRGDAHPVGRAGRVDASGLAVLGVARGRWHAEDHQRRRISPSPVRARPTWPSSRAPGAIRC